MTLTWGTDARCITDSHSVSHCFVRIWWKGKPDLYITSAKDFGILKLRVQFGGKPDLYTTLAKDFRFFKWRLEQSESSESFLQAEHSAAKRVNNGNETRQTHDSLLVSEKKKILNIVACLWFSADGVTEVEGYSRKDWWWARKAEKKGADSGLEIALTSGVLLQEQEGNTRKAIPPDLNTGPCLQKSELDTHLYYGSNRGRLYFHWGVI